MLIRRVVTAAVALPVLLAAVHFGGYAFAALAAAAAGGGAWELCRMAKAWGRAPFVPVAVALAAALAAAGLWADDSPTEVFRTAQAAALAAMVVSALFLFRARGGGLIGRAAATLSAALLVGGAMFHATTLRNGAEGPFPILFALAATFAADTGAYFVGRAFGSRKLAPAVSPNKTWEGAVGGLLSATAAGALAGAAAHLASPRGDSPDLAVLLTTSGAVGATLGIAGQFGDLYVSKLKRKAGFDDSGSIFPGHGGVLDRMDSLMFNVTVTAYLNPITLSRLF